MYNLYFGNGKNWKHIKGEFKTFKEAETFMKTLFNKEPYYIRTTFIGEDVREYDFGSYTKFYRAVKDNV